ncbi:MAG TPA: hypothetical protein RMH99_32560 [Sandaracinaceae bacterium LLY-WYZ-13_1]|nr:hypothetical protein [Sandaracinaceae bacterium LLY-WYZ-13_1]
MLTNTNSLLPTLAMAVAVSACGSAEPLPDAAATPPDDAGPRDAALPDSGAGATEDAGTGAGADAGTDGGAPNVCGRTAPAPHASFPVTYDMSRIELVEARMLTIEGASYRWSFYRNQAYRCGVEGYYSFVLLEPAEATVGSAPLWAHLHGGATGAYDEHGDYSCDCDSKQRARDPAGSVAKWVEAEETGFEEVLLHRRLREGWRVVLPHGCDHDLHSGIGNVYPHNPNWDAPPDTVDGLLGAMAAIDYAAHGGPDGTGASSPDIVVSGTSAGAAGAWSVTQAFRFAGVRLTAAVMDSYLLTTRLARLASAEDGEGQPLCRVPHRYFRIQGLIQDKIGPFVRDVELSVERNIDSLDVPLFDLTTDSDGQCCGDADELVAEAAAAGYDSNCAWLHGALSERIGPGSLHRVHVIPAMEPWRNHGILDSVDAEGHFIPQIEAFVAEAVARCDDRPFPD